MLTAAPSMPRGDDPLALRALGSPDLPLKGASYKPLSQGSRPAERGQSSSAISTRRHIAPPVLLQRSHSSSNSLSTSVSSGPTTPVFIAPLTPRRQAGSPMVVDTLAESTKHKRTASTVGLQQGRSDEESGGEDAPYEQIRVKEESLEPTTGSATPPTSQLPPLDRSCNELAQSKRRRVHIPEPPTLPQRPAMSDPPISPIVLGFDPNATLTNPESRQTMLKSMEMRRAQEALIQARRVEPGFSMHSEDFAESIASGVAARRGPAARSRNLTVSTHELNDTVTGAKSAPLRPQGFLERAHGSLPNLPPTAYPAMHGGEPHFQHLSSSYGPQAQSHRQYFAGMPPTASRAQHPMPALEAQSAPKAAFLSLFETFYDSLADSRVLSFNLDDQLRRSAALLQTLQSNTNSFETMLDKKLEDMGRATTKELQLLEGRLERIETRLGLGPPLAPLGKAALPERLARVEHATSSMRDQPSSA